MYFIGTLNREVLLTQILTAILILVAGGILALLANRRNSLAIRIGYFSCVAGCVCGLVPAFSTFFGFQGEEQCVIRTISFSFDILSALFLMPVFVIGMLAATHAVGYFDGHAGGRGGLFWFFFNSMLAAMTWVTIAVTPIEFLVAWELMGMMSFALVAFEYRAKETMRAAWVYLLACHAGAAFLILMFVYGGSDNVPPAFMAAVIVLGMAGFGLKIGFPVLHVWLPEAHPAAPAPVSAVMSASMINLGFYGILRMLVNSDGPLNIFGWTFLILGLAGASGGVLFALAQRNLKRLLAYSSVENMGIISIGFGLGFLGVEHGNLVMAVFGCAGAFLHMLNHAVLKGTLFLCAGSVLRATGLLNMDRLGGLLRRMPWTGSVFTFSSLSISGLPPFNGFLGEFLIYMAAFAGIMTERGAVFAASLLTVLALALIGGIAAAVFTKAVGAVFLGEPRSDNAAEAKPSFSVMQFPQVLLLLLTIGMTAGAPVICRAFSPLIQHFTGFPPDAVATEMFRLSEYIFQIALFSGVVLIFFLVLTAYRLTLPNGRREEVRGTWDCGFAEPTPRMEYTGTAFVQPLTDFFAGFLRPKKKIHPPEGLFPDHAEISVAVEDPAERGLWRPLFSVTGKAADRFHHLQSGSLHLYILIMVLALLAMLAWGFFFDREPEPDVSPQNSSQIVRAG